jgi:pyruvate dehydrogenase E2 component (dihydrolipoamide acetyltransferase)
MAVEIKMPQLSDTMNDGKIVEWKVKEGDEVNRGDILAEVETDKANLEIECFHKGIVEKILTPADEVANVGDVIAVIREPGESGLIANANNTPPAKSEPEDVKSWSPDSPEATPQTQPKAEPAHTNGTHSTHSDSERIKASPLARKLAEDRRIDLSSIKGTGPDGRIVKRDLEGAAQPVSTGVAASPQITTQKTTTSSPTPATQVPGEGRFEKLSKMRETIARRMQESVQTTPHFYVTTSIRMDSVQKLRAKLKEKEAYKGISINHFVIKAAAYALKAEPRVNCAMRDGQLYDPQQINIGIITAVEDGLLIPVIRNTPALSLQDIAFEARAAVERARAGRPSASDLTGGTFSISNMGMFDVENFTAIINPGQGGIIAVSSTVETPVVEDGKVIIAPVMKVTLSVDHRIIDGVVAGLFLKAFKEALEYPALLMK